MTYFADWDEKKLEEVQEEMHCSGHYKPKLVYKGDRFKKGFRQSGNDRDEYVANNNGGFTIGH